MEATTNHPDRGRRAVLDFSNHVLQYTTSGGLEAGISVSDGNLPATTPATPTKPVTTHSADYDMTTEAYTGPEPLYHTTYQVMPKTFKFQYRTKSTSTLHTNLEIS